MGHFLKRYGILLIVGWTLVIVVLAVMSVLNHQQLLLREAANEARDYFRLNLFYRAWAAQMGGVYADTGRVAPNPYLTVANRDITTRDGRSLTLVNPAYMTRMVFESIRASSPEPIISKITSLKPLNPINAPDPWERQSLQAIERREYAENFEMTAIGDKPYLRLISQFVIEESCLKCHGHQGYKIGDIRGGITISVPLSTRLATSRRTEQQMLGGYLLLWAVGSSGIALTSRRRSRDEESLVASELKFRTVCDFTQDWEYWIGPDGAFVYVSPSCLEITGYSRDEFMADRELTSRIVHPEHQTLFGDHHRENVINPNNETGTLEFKIITRQGETRWLEHHCRPVYEGGEYLGRRVSNRDITRQKRIAEERQQLERQMQQAQKLESLGVLAGGIAHDFNNILTAIIGHTDLAMMRLQKESPAMENLRRVQDAATRAADLAKQMLAYSGKGKFVIEDINLNLLVEEMTHMLQVSISKKVVLRLNLHQPLSTVAADATQLRQVIMNLVINASEAIGERSGVIAINSGCIHCDRAYLQSAWLDEQIPEGLYVYLEIADTGCGMSKETMARVFDPFFTTKFTGRGLGMAAVLGIIRGHKGAIRVYSELGKGTTFKVLLPASNRPAELFDQQSEPSCNWRGQGTVLLVDDEETVLGISGEMLRELGFDVITAADGRQAIAQFQTHREQIACVILDLTMPQLDGEQTFRELRQQMPDIKVIMSSGYNEQEVTQKFVGKGLAGFIQKPYKLSILREKLYGVLGERETSA